MFRKIISIFKPKLIARTKPNTTTKKQQIEPVYGMCKVRDDEKRIEAETFVPPIQICGTTMFIQVNGNQYYVDYELNRITNVMIQYEGDEPVTLDEEPTKNYSPDSCIRIDFKKGPSCYFYIHRHFAKKMVDGIREAQEKIKQEWIKCRKHEGLPTRQVRQMKKEWNRLIALSKSS